MQDPAYIDGHDDEATTNPSVDLESDTSCYDCGGKVEWYWVHNNLWTSTMPPEERDEWICVRCFGRRLGRPLIPDDLNDFFRQKAVLIERLSVPYGYCYCTCGEKTKVARYTQTSCGWVKDEPLRFIFNHHRRLTPVQSIEIKDQGYTTPCWVWQGTPRDGYGRIYRDGRLWNAHIWFYQVAKGPIPDGKQLDHLCHQNCPGGSDCPHRACVNPDHLEPKTQAENIRAGVKSRGKPSHCKHGHAFTPENTIVRSDGSWRCRTCDNATQRRCYYKRASRAGVQPRKRLGSET